ncbi:hypothetical protein Agabi119p4_4656 [Agaricus bisporus var. burnettii]|uniref:Mitochondrial inner membrane protease subunit 2 n=1 Tax=Agaricus bisporus var. burnettii TaxID=192524 RepID=A0A8H7F3R6_AGABI|nr:hypothetical protein Agabi119p4_4656 [Agaricus bisporus var. burnettii]
MLRSIFAKTTPRSNQPKLIRKCLYWSPLPLFCLLHFYEINTVRGGSMKPTLSPDSSAWNDICLFDRYSIHTLHDYNREDIVTLRCPTNPKRIIIKRILAVAGDTVKTRPPCPEPEVKVPQGHVWVEGDESFRSDDSNLYGPIPAALIESKLTRILWPPERYGPLIEPSIPINCTGPAYRHANDAIQRAKARRARVKIGRPYNVDADTY